MRILVVEDEPKGIWIVECGLTAGRYAVNVVADGRDDLEMAQTYPYELIILDLMLPRMDGRQILQSIRRLNTSVPVLVLTARATLKPRRDSNSIRDEQRGLCWSDPLIKDALLTLLALVTDQILWQCPSAEPELDFACSPSK